MLEGNVNEEKIGKKWRIAEKSEEKRNKKQGVLGGEIRPNMFEICIGELCTLFPINNFSFELLKLQV